MESLTNTIDDYLDQASLTRAERREIYLDLSNTLLQAAVELGKDPMLDQDIQDYINEAAEENTKAYQTKFLIKVMEDGGTLQLDKPLVRLMAQGVQFATLHVPTAELVFQEYEKEGQDG
jgi:hypothetical protein